MKPQFLSLAFAVLTFAGQASAEAGRLLVVAPDAFHPALKDFIAHKRSLLPTDLLSLEEILRTSPGIDHPEKLKRYLFQQWKEHNAAYVLLVGDVDRVPVRY